MESEEDSSGVMDDDELERLQFMAKYYLRSKSLPMVYFPQQSYHQSHNAPENAVRNPNGLHVVREDSTESQESRGGRDSEFNSIAKNEEGMKIEVVNGAGDSVLAKELRASKKRANLKSLTTNYYPEGGWGWIITFCAVCCHALTFGFQIYLSNVVLAQFKQGFLGALSLGISLLLSPVWVSICKRKSTRLSAVFGGLVASLGCLFTSFASQFHQLFFSYGAFIGVGVGLTRDASTLMVGQYFKRKRDMVEIVVVSGAGLGIIIQSVAIHAAITSLGWRLGLQAITGSLLVTFFLGTCYR